MYNFSPSIIISSYFVTQRKRTCEKLMFSHVSVCRWRGAYPEIANANCKCTLWTLKQQLALNMRVRCGISIVLWTSLYCPFWDLVGTSHASWNWSHDMVPASHPWKLDQGTYIPSLPSFTSPLLVTSSGGNWNWNTYGFQASSMHPTGMFFSLQIMAFVVLHNNFFHTHM